MERRKKANRNPKQVVEREAENESDSTDREDDSPEQLAKKRRIEEIIRKKVEGVLNRIHPSTSQPEPPPRASTHNPKAAEIIPLFDPEMSEITSGNWLSKIDQLGFIHGWDDEAKAFYMQAMLAGIARLWYNGLKEYNKTWDDWKQALLNAFPSHEYFIDNLKKLLARKKLSTETMMNYYYSKCSLIRKCEISDSNAVSCVIDGLPAEFQGTAKSGNFKNPQDLYKGFLCKIDVPVPMKTDDVARKPLKCDVCHKSGHTSRTCYFRTENSRTGDVSKNRPVFHKPKECTHCGKTGHERDNCWHLNPAKVHLLQRQVNNPIYNIHCKGFIDTGSQVNLAHTSLLNKLNLELKPSKILIKGIGNETIMPKGMDHVLFGFESFSVSSDVHFVDANMGDIEVIIGQPIINNRELSLKIQGQNLVLEKLTQIKKYPIELKESVCICPSKTALIHVKPINHSPNRCLLVKAKNVEFPERYNILSTVIRTSDDSLTVTNTGSQNMCWEKGRIITRAIDYVESDLKTTNHSDCK
jgi:hypothetical protein